jgi:subtilase family serine protease/prenyltransferase beta subunit/formylmethanofuran dehydrogenase subunit C
MGSKLFAVVKSIILTFVLSFSIIGYSDQVTDDAKQWLRNQKNEDGSWGSGTKQLPDTAEAFYALWYQSEPGIFLSQTLSWITALDSEENALQISRRLYVLNHSTFDKTLLYSKLASLQNSDGGFGAAFKYQSSPLITAMTLRALTESPQPDGTVIANALNYLITSQQDNGCWKRQEHDIPGSEYSDIAVTALIVSIVRQYQIDKSYFSTNLTSAVAEAGTFLETVQNSNNTWGTVPGEVLQTALATAALQRTTRPQSLNETIIWLKSQQLTDGSFDDSVYKTATVLNVLRDWEYSPVPEPSDITVTVDDITFSPETPDTTTQILITAQLRNIGASKASNVGIRFYDGDPAAGGIAIGPQLKLTEIGPASSGTVQLGVYLAAGTHNIYAVADPDNIIIEADENNNHAVKPLTVAAALLSTADLMITANDITITVPDSNNPNQVVITAIVSNRGETPIANAVLQLFDGTEQLGENYILKHIAGNGTYTFTLTTTLPPGARNIFVKLDPDALIAEADENNNNAMQTVTITNLPPAAPTGLTAETGDTQVILRWTANQEPDILGYNVYRDTVKITNEPITVIGFKDTNLTNGLSYSYKITAVDKYEDGNGNDSESNLSDEVTVTPDAAVVNRPVITIPATAGTPFYTDIPTVTVGGTATTGNLINVYVNNELRAENFTALAGEFSIDIPLTEGENIITAKAVQGSAESALSETVIVHLTLNVDLSVTLAFSNPSPTAEQQFGIIANVTSSGAGTARNVTVKFYDGDPTNGGIMLGDGFTVPALASAATANLTVNSWLSAGTHSIYVVVDDSNKVIETDETNNSTNAAITIGTALYQPPDFVITVADITFSENEPSSIETVTITAKITNSGGALAPLLNVSVYDGDPANGGIQLGDDIIFRNIGSGSDATLNFQTMLSAGTHQLYVVADRHNTVTEADETNNRAFNTITVIQSPSLPADLLIDSSNITFSNTAPLAVEQFTVSALITNQGGISADNITVRFYDGDPEQGGSQIGSNLTFSGIAPGGQAQVSMTTALTAGAHRLYIVADPVNTIAESNELNNAAYGELTVGEAPLPDLTITELSTDAEDIHSGDLVKLQTTIPNNGPGSATNLKVRLYQGNPAAGGVRVSRDIVIPEILPGTSASIELNWTAAFGEHTLYAIVDPDNLLPETDEFNNSNSITLAVAANNALPPVTDPEIQAAIDKGVAWLKTQQHPDPNNGSFFYYSYNSYGPSALALLAILHGGVTEDNPVVAKALRFLDTYLVNGNGAEEQWMYGTYAPALVIMAYQATGNKAKYFDRVQELTNILIRDCYYAAGNYNWGLFYYGDLSNTQYGYLALHATAQWGIAISDHIIEEGTNRMFSDQHSDGGWGYAEWHLPQSYGSMTAAGTMILRILGQPVDEPHTQAGIKWLADHYPDYSNGTPSDPGQPNNTIHYFLYSLERSMSIPTLIPELKAVDPVTGATVTYDWYQDGASFLVGSQFEDGHWNNRRGNLVATSFSLLFLERAVPEISESDLIVETVSFSDPAPVQGGSVTVTAAIKNDDLKNITSPFKVAFYDGDPNNGGVQIGEDKIIPALNGQSSTPVTVAWTISSSETHTVYVVADPDNTVEENDETNNVGTAQLTVNPSSGFTITVTTDKLSYTPEETMTATFTVTNIGSIPADGTVPATVRDSDGAVITTFPQGYLTALAPGSEYSFTRTWQIPAGTLPATYRAEAVVKSSEVKMAAGYSDFAVEPTYGVSSVVTADKISYGSLADVVITSKVRSETSNFTYSDVKVRITVTAPDTSILYSNIYSVDELQPERLELAKLQWNTATTPPGEYTVYQTVLDSDGITVLAEDNTKFTITSSLETDRIAGTVTVTPKTVEGGETFSINWSITNTGNVDINAAEALLLVIEPLGSVKYTSSPEPVTLAMGATLTGILDNVPSTSLSIGQYPVLLRLRKDTGISTLAGTSVSIVDTVLPVIANLSPAHNSLINDATLEISAALTDNFSGINADSITLSVDGSPVAHSYSSTSGIVSFTPTTVLTDDPHTVVLTVTDNAGNSATSNWSFTVDATPPTITNLSPPDNSTVNDANSIISAIVIDNESGIASTAMTVDGNSVTANYVTTTGLLSYTPQTLLTDTAHPVTVVVTDNAGNSTTATWQFTVQTEQPTQTALIFHNSSNGRLDISGSDKQVNGSVHSNATIRIVGNNNDITGPATAVGTVTVKGSGHDLTEQQPNAPIQTMPVYDMNYYRTNANYTHNGTWHIKKNSNIQPGIHYVNGDVKITGKDITANVTIVATGDIRITGKSPKLTTADSENNMLLFSGGDIHLSGNSANLRGIIYAPNGDCQITSSGETITGAVIANTVDISGSGITFNPITE